MKSLFHLVSIVAFCASIAWWAVSVEAKNIYVDNQAGDDHATGQQAENRIAEVGPVRTIAKAIRLANAGDHIVLRKNDEPYRESFAIAGSRCSGNAMQPFTIMGSGAILDGSSPAPAEAWKHERGAIFRFEPPRMSSPLLFLDGRPAPRAFVPSTAKEVPDLQPRHWCSLGGRIYFCVEKGKLPGDYALSYSHLQTGITLYHASDIVIEDLTVQGFQVDGIALANSARNVLLVSVNCRGNGRSGVSVGGASSARLNACLLGDNGQSQLLTMLYSETAIQNSHLLSNTAPGWVDQGGRVYLDSRRVQGGLDEVQPPEATKASP